MGIKNTINLILVLFVVALIFYAVSGGHFKKNESVDQASMDMAIRSKVKLFGGELKNVSLLSPTTLDDMEEKYSAYLSPALLREWENNPMLALGRLTSSPYPDRIEVLSTTEVDDSIYKVEGNVVEVTTTDLPGNPASVYPVTLTLEKVGNSSDFLITKIEKGEVSSLPQEVTVKGVGECLPHAGDPNAPNTMECAFGIVEDKTGKHYALDLQNIENGMFNFETGVHVRVTGTLVPKNQLNTDMWNKYDIVGILSADKLENL